MSPRRIRLTVPDKSPRYPPVLIGTLEEQQVKLRGGQGTERVYAATCERCGRLVTRATSAEAARKDLERHRDGCRPPVGPRARA